MSQPMPRPPGPGPDLLDDYERAGPGRVRAWLAENPAGHGTTLAVPGLWGLGGLLHAMGTTPGWGIAGTLTAAAGAAAVSEWVALRPVQPWEEAPAVFRPAETAAAVGAGGGWVTAAAAYGAPLWGPHAWLTYLWFGGSTAAYWAWLRRHDAVQAARIRLESRRTFAERKAFWDDLITRLPQLSDGNGADVLRHMPTPVGEMVCLDTRGTGHMATEISRRKLEERIGELWPSRLPRGRIEVWTDDYPGRIWIAVRTQNPWRKPILHPLLGRPTPAARYMPEQPTARCPLLVGLDPEDGEPFGLVTSKSAPAGLPLFVPDQGGQVILVAGTKGAGKTNALNVITAAALACDDNRVLQINLTAPAEMRAWSGACPANALGRHELGRARAILQWAENYINDWGEAAFEAHAVPTLRRPHLTVIIDEVADVASDPVCRDRLRAIARLCRKAGVTLIIAGQRGTASWMGGADVRALIDILVVGRFTQAGEIDKIIGAHFDLPDISAYGGGAHGVFMIVDRASGDFDRGRMLKLKEPRDMRKIARARAGLADWTPPDMAADQAWLWDAITTWDEVPLDAWTGPPEDVSPDEPEPRLDAPGTARDGRPAGPGGPPSRAWPEPAAGPRPAAPDGRAARLDALAAALAGDWQRAYPTVGIKPADAAVKLLALIADGTSNKDAARILLGNPGGRQTIQRWAGMLTAAGLVAVEGDGANRRRQVTAAGRAFLDRALTPAGAPGGSDSDGE